MKCPYCKNNHQFSSETNKCSCCGTEINSSNINYPLFHYIYDFSLKLNKIIIIPWCLLGITGIIDNPHWNILIYISTPTLIFIFILNIYSGIKFKFVRTGWYGYPYSDIVRKEESPVTYKLYLVIYATAIIFLLLLAYYVFII